MWLLIDNEVIIGRVKILLRPQKTPRTSVWSRLCTCTSNSASPSLICQPQIKIQPVRSTLSLPISGSGKMQRPLVGIPRKEISFKIKTSAKMKTKQNYWSSGTWWKIQIILTAKMLCRNRGWTRWSTQWWTMIIVCSSTTLTSTAISNMA